MKNYKYQKVEPVVVTIPLVPFVSITLGLSILIWVIWPIVSFHISRVALADYTITPLAENVMQAVKDPVTDSEVDFTDVNNWLPHNSVQKKVTPVDTYFLTIPKVRIVNSLVKIGENDLSKNLIHYGGTGLPGKYGNAVIFGHSILPAFYDPKNYLAIFSLLPTLEKGDDIFVRFDGVDYRYEVISSRVTNPEDVSGLEQPYDDSYITLVTCVPPGTYWKRLWLVAKLTPFSSGT